MEYVSHIILYMGNNSELYHPYVFFCGIRFNPDRTSLLAKVMFAVT